MTTAANAALKATIQRIHDQAAGAVAVEVVRRADLPELMGHALAGDSAAITVLQIVNHALAGIQNAPADRPMLCATCPAPLRDGRFAMVATYPLRDDVVDGMALAICHRCATTVPEIKAKATKALRRFWPDGRLLPAPAAGGRA